MEIIKKQVLQALTTGTTTGCTGSCRIIIPDLTANYFFKICLSQETQDIGFFDTYTINDYGGYDGYDGYDGKNINNTILLVNIEPIGIDNLL